MFHPPSPTDAQHTAKATPPHKQEVTPAQLSPSVCRLAHGRLTAAKSSDSSPCSSIPSDPPNLLFILLGDETDPLASIQFTHTTAGPNLLTEGVSWVQITPCLWYTDALAVSFMAVRLGRRNRYRNRN